MIQRAANAAHEEICKPGPDLPHRVARAVLRAVREPTPEMIADVVKHAGDPTPEQWALGERACIRNKVVSMAGDTACAEIARDWQAMIDRALAE